MGNPVQSLPNFNHSRGTVTASGVWTGNETASAGDAIADLLLGVIGSSSIATQTQNNYIRNLTLNVGARYEVDGPPCDLYGRMTNFLRQYGVVAVANPANVPSYAQSVALASKGTPTASADSLGIPQSLIYTNYSGVAPRIGIDYPWLNAAAYQSVPSCARTNRKHGRSLQNGLRLKEIVLPD